MIKQKNTKRALATSVIALVICFAMLLGTTYAWFTDSVSSNNNIIKAGTLDVEMDYKNSNHTEWTSIEDSTGADPRFFVDAEGNDILWEPGVMSFAQFRVTNEGTLALKYNFTTNSTHNTLTINGVEHNLEEVIKVKLLDGSQTPTRSDIEGYTDWSDFAAFSGTGYLLPKGQTPGDSREFTVVLYWAPTDNDNLYNANNGRFVSDYEAAANNNYLWINAGVRLIATQYTHESDSFDKLYDKFATYTQTASASAVISQNEETFVLVDNAPAPLFGNTEVEFPAESFAAGAQEVKLTTRVDSLGVAANVTGFKVNNDKELASATITLTATVDGNVVTSFNGKYVKVETYVSKGLNNVTVEYNGEGEGPKNVTYDPATGLLTFETNHFSEWIVWCELNPETSEVKDYVYDADNNIVTVYTPAGLAWVARMVNTNDETWNWFGGMTVKLGADIDLAGALWVPIGNYSTFDGDFDGAGHTVKNMRMNVYEQQIGYVSESEKATIKECFGLFGFATGGTIKNLTVDSAWVFSEGKPIGAVAGVASGGTTFENITVKNCTLNGYQNGTGGVVGNAYNMNEGNTVLTLKNITVDETNVFNTNYTSPDTLIGGLIGQVFPLRKGTMKTVLKDCSVSAKIMALNDVVANYQWYRYRNSGMLIGTLREVNMDAEGFNALDYVEIDNVKVTYDTWNQQRYCEFHEAGHPSYAGEGDWRFFRIDEDDNGNHNATYVREAGTVVVADMNQHYHYEDETHDVLLVFDQLIGAGTGGTCVRTLEGVTVTYLNGSEPAAN